MSSAKVEVHELIAWDLDDYPYRNAAANLSLERLADKVQQAQGRLSEREQYRDAAALLEPETQTIEPLLTAATQREDLQQEYKHFDWTLGVIDLRLLLAFQRRLIFSPLSPPAISPMSEDWPALISLSIGSQRSTEHVLIYNHSEQDRLDISLHSTNPDLQLRFHPKQSGRDVLPLSLHGGSPFFEVAQLRGRWFLRDGYHRAYHLLKAGVYRVPAVVIHAQNVEQLGATEPWFFNQDQLFSVRPPRVTDFLDHCMVLRYERTALRKAIRIRIEESLEPFDEIDEA